MRERQEITRTAAERRLAGALRARKLKFKTNQNIGGYEVDFWFPDCRLAVEVDGYYHMSEVQRKLDRQKEQFLMDKGILLIRFNNQQIREHLAECVQKVQRILAKINALKDQRPINDEWKAVLKSIKFPDPAPLKKQPESIEQIFLSMDDQV